MNRAESQWAEVHAHEALRRAVAWFAFAFAVVAGVGGLALSANNGPGGPFIVLVIPMVFVMAAVFKPCPTRNVRVAGDSVEIVATDGTVRRTPRAGVTAMAIAGGSVLGFATRRRLTWSAPAQLVLTGADGSLRLARTITWLRVAELEQFAHAHGITWNGVLPYPVDATFLAPTGWPTDVPPPTAPLAVDDPATASTLGDRRRRAWIIAMSAAAVAVFFLSIGASLAGDPKTAANTIGSWTFGLIGGAAFFFFTGPLRNQSWHAAQRLLGVQPWWPVEVVVYHGVVPGDSGLRVRLVDPATGAPGDPMAITQGGRTGWLEASDRAWFVCAASADRKKLVIAPPDRSAVALCTVPPKPRGQAGFG